MTDFETYKSMCESEGIVASHNFGSRIVRRDSLQDGDILFIPKNVTCFRQTFQDGHSVEFVVFPTTDGDLRRLYLGWLDRGKGTMIDDLEESISYEDFFLNNEGRQFKVTIKDDESAEQILPNGTRRIIKNYHFRWVN